jgi:hypothetical protein
MKLARHCFAWCWALYALPCLVLLIVSAAGHSFSENARLLVWIYGFPSTALWLPVLALLGTFPVSDFTLTCLVAGAANGALLCTVGCVVRNAMKPDPDEETPELDRALPPAPAVGPNRCRTH